ncbi:hypothetical protein HYU92_03680 [Candidatus Curtissbacteria bacterium]|nr:hypothetical protein [Candidatus Curtissbacteria bacterium]
MSLEIYTGISQEQTFGPPAAYPVIRLNSDERYNIGNRSIKALSLSTNLHMVSLSNIVREALGIPGKAAFGRATPHVYEWVIGMIADHNQKSPQEAIHPILVNERNGKNRYLLPRSQQDITIKLLKENMEDKIVSDPTEKPTIFLKNSPLGRFFAANPAESPTAQQLLGRLTKRQRYAFKARYFDNKSLEEIATMLGVSKGEASRLHRKGRNRLESLVNRNNR